MYTSFIIIIIFVLVVIISVVAYRVNCQKKHKTNLEKNLDKLMKSGKINEQNKDKAEKAQTKTEEFIKDKLKNIDEMLRKEQENH